ncbi:MAG: YggT family protein [Alphaproteobacteria bacterium]|nr:YggT family protein [Alphaproteobacteria bacterium]MCB9974201.1 YggT family protein [Rhodospirillales bacterium]
MFLIASLVWIIATLVQIFIMIIILEVALSWLIAFELVNAENEAARNLTNLLKRITDPVYKPIRKFVPPVGGIDLTPLIVIIGVQFLAGLIFKLIGMPFLFF